VLIWGLHNAAFCCSDKTADINNSRKNLFWLTVSEVSIRVWCSSAAHIMVANEESKKERERGERREKRETKHASLHGLTV
jgi:hypothetical protein